MDINYGLIAQEVKQIVPEAINILTASIPSIYMDAKNILLTDDNLNVIIIVDIPTNSNLRIGGNVELVVDNETKLVKVIVFTITTLIVEKWNNFNINQNVFVYGAEINDFHILDKDYMGILNMGGIQELTKKKTIIEAQINTLENNNNMLQDTLQYIQESNEELNNQIKILEKQIASLQSKKN